MDPTTLNIEVGNAPKLQSKSIVRLNIGGTKFQTTSSTLLNYDKGYFFIDRDGKYFEPILEYLRTGELNIPPHLSREMALPKLSILLDPRVSHTKKLRISLLSANFYHQAVLREADYYSIDLPKHGKHELVTLTEGLFLSDKYRENEVVLFGDDGMGFIIRGGSSKVEFNYKIKSGEAIEVAWKTDSALAKSPSKEREKDKDKAKRSGNKTNLWFLSGPSLITSAVNIYSFLPQLPHLVPGTVYYNIKTPLTIYETGQIFGFRFPPREEIETALDESRDRRDSVTECVDFGTSPQRDSTVISTALGGYHPGNFVYCDIRNQWVRCHYIKSKFCNNLDSIHLRYKSAEPIRHKSFLSYYNHEYEMCYETFTIELLVFERLLLARLVNYNLVRKDRSIIPVQFTTNFVSYRHEEFTDERLTSHSVDPDGCSDAKS